MKKNNLIYSLIILVIILIIFSLLFISLLPNKKPTKNIEEVYNPNINASDFVNVIDNPYFTLTPGTKYVYQSITPDGLEKNEVYVTNETKDVLGINTTIVWDRVWLNEKLTEDTKDYYAQDKIGNVWYFGEESKTIANNTILNYEGSWEAGVDSAKPGIIMKAYPKIDDIYRQEYYKGSAEDMGKIISLNETVKIGSRTYHNCLQTSDFSPLELGVEENKYYCKEVGSVALETNTEDQERTELISVEYNTSPSPSIIQKELKIEITKDKAKEIALKEIPGRVTDIAIEEKFGKPAYVVEIQPDDKTGETDVIIDVYTGEFLVIEK